MTSEQLIDRLIIEAIENKYDYNLMEIEFLTKEIRDHFDKTLPWRNHLRPPADIRQDIVNQLTVLRTVLGRSPDARAQLDASLPVSFLHGMLTGNLHVDDHRTEEFVPDLGGLAITPVEEIAPRLAELEMVVRLAADTLHGLPGKSQAVWLAHIFSSIIRVHPFTDANGRTARAVTFYLLHCWGKNVFPIPKVRNDDVWKNALDSALSGNLTSLSAYFVDKMDSEMTELTQNEREFF